MENLGKTMVDLALAGVGAVAILAEKTGEVVQDCAKKGGETLEKGRVASEELRRKGELIAQERRERCAQEALERLTAEEREELRRKLADLDLRDTEAAKAAAEAEKIIDITPEE